ncbi:MAG: DUF805 domain-containing protein [Gallionella sp.]|nr:DUF805 domain-containing protein [Gallionella sp.]MDD4945481.1 DUF805 domain-containing protein [Gallionella sp.]
MNWYLEVLKKYAVFEGRARRTEYWMFFLFNFIIGVALAILELALGGHDLLVNVYQAAVLVPSIAVAVRRMHDIGRSGWWILLPIVDFVFLLLDSQDGDNEYGPNPKAVAA